MTINEKGEVIAEEEIEKSKLGKFYETKIIKEEMD